MERKYDHVEKIERGVNMCETHELDVNDFRDVFFELQKNEAVQNKVGRATLDEILKFTEKENIVKALEICDGNKTKAAEILGISRTALHHKIRKHDL